MLIIVIKSVIRVTGIKGCIFVVFLVKIMILCNFKPIFPQRVNPLVFGWFVLLCLQYLPTCPNVSPNVQWNMVILVGHVNFMLFFYFSFMLGTQRELGYLWVISFNQSKYSFLKTVKSFNYRMGILLYPPDGSAQVALLILRNDNIRCHYLF